MKLKLKWIFPLIWMACLGLQAFGHAQSISEKKASLHSTSSDLDAETESFLLDVNRQTQELHESIRSLYKVVYQLHAQGAPEEQYKDLLAQINECKSTLLRLEHLWHEMASRGGQHDSYGLWHAPDTTLEQLIIDYGSQDYVYLIPPEVGLIKLSIDSNLPIPRSSWSEMLELILAENGVGIKDLNPYLRQLFLIKQNHCNIKLITNCRQELEILSPDCRITFVISPDPSELRRSFLFLEKFINPNTTVLHVLGRDIMIVGPVSDIQDLLKLYDFIAINRGDKEYRLIPTRRLRAEDMARILETIFDQQQEVDGRRSFTGENKEDYPPGSMPDLRGLKIVILENLAQALFLVGTKDELEKAEEIICNVEGQISGARDREVFWYTVKHSDPEELADVLYRIYSLLITTGTGNDEPPSPQSVQNEVVVVEKNQSPPLPPPPPRNPVNPYDPGFYQEGGFVVNPVPAQPGVFVETNPNRNRDNFIVDAKTGTIVMVIESDLMPRIRELLCKLDVPKKMVQIETLLFEKVLARENNFGLKLLRTGDFASNCDKSGVLFNDLIPCCKDILPMARGVFDFLISRKQSESGIPAFDMVYRFLLSQDDVQINTCPSILTLNQTPATIVVTEDISLNTGVFEIRTDTGVALKDAYTRAQYGTTISIKPTIHMTDETAAEDEQDYVTLETDITFDTFNPCSNPNRPDVTRRHITNQFQAIDGETVVVGGLRRKISNEGRESIPFIGELPGIGKLFSYTTTKDSSTEMFVLITPRIVRDPREELDCMRQELLCRRPGDIPYFLECVEQAHQFERARLMQGSMRALFGAPPPRYYGAPTGECGYDGF